MSDVVKYEFIGNPECPSCSAMSGIYDGPVSGPHNNCRCECKPAKGIPKCKPISKTIDVGYGDVYGDTIEIISPKCILIQDYQEITTVTITTYECHDSNTGEPLGGHEEEEWDYDIIERGDPYVRCEN